MLLFFDCTLIHHNINTSITLLRLRVCPPSPHPLRENGHERCQSNYYVISTDNRAGGGAGGAPRAPRLNTGFPPEEQLPVTPEVTEKVCGSGAASP